MLRPINLLPIETSRLSSLVKPRRRTRSSESEDSMDPDEDNDSSVIDEHNDDYHHSHINDSANSNE